MNRLKLLIVVIALSLVSSCGYRLAGKADLDPVFESTHVSYQGRGHAMAKLLEKQFEANKYQLVSAEQASALVDVLYETTDREILSVDEDGKVREYELILRVGVDVKNSEGKKLVGNQEVRLSRDFLFDINDVLGKGSEEQAIYQEMRADAARLILYRLQAITIEEIAEEETKQ
ncbi:MAG: LPS assembly lipoprotein LptE [Gammaproteobacteria bacterium]